MNCTLGEWTCQFCITDFAQIVVLVRHFSLLQTVLTTRFLVNALCYSDRAFCHTCRNQSNGQWHMFRLASKGAFFTLDLHSWTDDGQAACEVLRPCEAAAATESYLLVIKQTLGK